MLSASRLLVATSFYILPDAFLHIHVVPIWYNDLLDVLKSGFKVITGEVSTAISGITGWAFWAIDHEAVLV